MKDYSKRLAALEMSPARCAAIDALVEWVLAMDQKAVSEWLAGNPMEDLTPRMAEVMNQAPAHILSQLAAVGLALRPISDGC